MPQVNEFSWILSSFMLTLILMLLFSTLFYTPILGFYVNTGFINTFKMEFLI